MTTPKMPTLRSAANNERGVISTLFAILLATGFILTLVALVIDSGQIYLQRVKLQNAASLVATAAAKNCSAKNITCTSSLSSASTFQKIANSASPNHANFITNICGSSAAHDFNPTLAVCGSLDTANPHECKPVDVSANAQYAKYVRVHVSSVSNSGENSAFFPLFQSLIDPTAASSERITACAQYAYGKASSILTDEKLMPLPVVKVAISECDLVALNPLQTKNPETGNSQCSFTDKDGLTFTSNLHGHLIYKFGGSPCGAGETIEVGEQLCVSDWEGSGVTKPTRAGLINQIQNAIIHQRDYQIPVVSNLSKSGSQWLSTVSSFAGVRFQSFRWAAQSTPASNYQCISYPSNVVRTGAAYCNTSAWSFCDGNTKYCFTATVQPNVSIARGSSKNHSGPNFGLESLTPLP
jgi:Flp pilus assembly protein TadG